MTRLQVLQIDAFTTEPYGGNPCAVVLEADALSESAMQRIAMEMNLSETAFVLSSNQADFRARYFTPSEEIPLAGHPTIATTFALLETDRISYDDQEEIRLELEAGVITIEIAASESGRPLITMSQQRPQFMEVYDPADVLPAFGLGKSDALPDAPVRTVSTGTPQLMVPLASLESLRRARLRIDRYRQLRASGDFFSPHLFVPEGLTPREARSRGTSACRPMSMKTRSRGRPREGWLPTFGIISSSRSPRLWPNRGTTWGGPERHSSRWWARRRPSKRSR